MCSVGTHCLLNSILPSAFILINDDNCRAKGKVALVLARNACCQITFIKLELPSWESSSEKGANQGALIGSYFAIKVAHTATGPLSPHIWVMSCRHSGYLSSLPFARPHVAALFCHFSTLSPAFLISQAKSIWKCHLHEKYFVSVLYLNSF